MTARRLTLAEALRDALAVALRSDSTVFLLGEDLGVPGGFGGGFTVTLGLADEFGHDRVMDTPISEAAIVGAAIGAAMIGMRPVAEMQYGDFVFGAMDQVVNQAAKMHYMSNGQVRVPLVLRLPVGASNRGAQHGQCSEAWFLHTPGLKVVCPSNPYDAKGLLLASIRDGNPVMFLEHKLLYGGKGGRKEKASLDLTADVPEGDYEVPLGTVAVRRLGTDLTILANMLMVHRALAAAEQRAIPARVGVTRSFPSRCTTKACSPLSKSATAAQVISIPSSPLGVALTWNGTGGGVVSATAPVFTYSLHAAATRSVGSHTASFAFPLYDAAATALSPSRSASQACFMSTDLSF